MFLEFHGSTLLQFVSKTSLKVMEHGMELPGKFIPVSLSIPHENILEMLLEIIGHIPSLYWIFVLSPWTMPLEFLGFLVFWEDFC